MRECLLSGRVALAGLVNVTRAGNDELRFCQERQNQRGISPSIVLTVHSRLTRARARPTRLRGSSGARNGIFLEILFKSFRTETLAYSLGRE